MSKVSCDEMCNMDMIVDFLRPQLEITKEYNNIIYLNVFLQTSDILPGQALIRVSHIIKGSIVLIILPRFLDYYKEFIV